MPENLFLIPLAPFMGAAVLFLFGRDWKRDTVHGVTTFTMALALAQAASLFFLRLPAVVEEGGLHQSVWTWMTSGDLKIDLALRMDSLSGLLCLVVTGIGTLIHVYSWGYMAHDKDYRRFFAYLNLFCGAMLILVLGDSLPVMFIGWEGVGLCSYLLIGFWYEHTPNATAGKKAFITNRVGDFAFILGMFLLYETVGTLNFSEITRAAAGTGGALVANWHGMPVAFWVGLLLFIGACGKSAQIPLFVWLPDAMAGPTPVSALIHAATMVTAGVYMVARLHAVYILSPAMMAIVAVVGALTALFAAAIGFAQNDFKKVLAYSTVSQLGFMFAGVGTGNFQGGIAHLFTHAFFKAGLFLCAGSVMHAMSGSGDITRMGGLRRRVPKTWLVFGVCWLAICGVPPFAGFFSKDAIIAGAFATEIYGPQAMVGKVVGVILMLAALGTAFYMSRLYYLVFSGDEPRCDDETRHHIHESPSEMVGPLFVLGAGALVGGVALCFPGGLLGHPTWNVLGHWLEPAVGPEIEIGHGLEVGMMVASVIIALIGIFAARAIYRGGFGPPALRFAGAFPALLKLAQDKFRVDELYAFLIIRPVRRLSQLVFRVVDRFIVDGVLVGVGPRVVDTAGRVVRVFQAGDLQSYLAVFTLGAALLVYFAKQPTAFVPRVKVEISGTSARIDASPGKASGRVLTYRFDCQSDGTWEQESRDSIVSCRYGEPGRYKVRVQVEDRSWQSRDTFSQTVEIK